MSMDEVLILYTNLPANSLIIVPGFNTDSKKVPYYNPEAVRLISRSANAPVFYVIQTWDSVMVHSEEKF